MSDVAARLAEVRVRIASACRACGRPPESVRLVAVSKLQPASQVRAAYEAGQRDFGENYVQELQAKRIELADLAGLRWHVIGHVQTNKARQVSEAAFAVHSVDSERLASELGRRATTAGRVVQVLVEVNVAGEAQKSGCAPPEVSRVLAAVEREPALALVGLMTVPPYSDDPEEAGPPFEALAKLRDEHGGAARLPELSMGMTQDLEVAIRHGATMVRVGTAIFGARG